MAVMLDEDQLKIVNADVNEKNICVVAGAGSGKTTVLTERIRHLIEKEGVTPIEIVAITFTNAAADEMRERLSDIKDVDTMFIGTIHSFANALLHASMPDVDYTVLSDEKFKWAADVVCKQYCKKLTGEKLVAFMDMVEKNRNGRVSAEECENFLDIEEQSEFSIMMRPDVEEQPVKGYPESIFSWCEKRNILTFDNIIRYAKTYLNEAFVFPYLFVDEYQDVGLLEDCFVRSLNAEHTFIVGDDWQSIYGFKGANVNIFKMYVMNPDWKVYHLERNYRSAEEIIRLAESVIADDDERLPKNVKIMSKEHGSVKLDHQKELIWHLKAIRKSKDYKNWFLLARTRKDINQIYDFCNMIGLPAFFFSREGLSKEQEQELLEKDAVKIATVHGVKGLESECVMLYGRFPIHGEMSENCWKNPQKRARWYEERRIMYVGVTRAKSKLVLLADENL